VKVNEPKGEYQEAGRLLKVLKAAKPRGVTWEPYLEDLCIPLTTPKRIKLLGFRRLGTEQAMPQKAKNGIGRATEKSGRSKREFSYPKARVAATLPNFAARKGGLLPCWVPFSRAAIPRGRATNR
jgi:hypothetical protein